MTLTFLPIGIPFAAGLLLLVWREKPLWQKGVSLVAALLMMWSSFALLESVRENGIHVFRMGNWVPPFGIALVADTLGAFMTVIASLVGLCGLLYAFHDIDKHRMRGAFYALYFFLFLGINGSFLTGDLFNLFVFFEVLLMTSYVLLVLGNRQHQVKAGFIYLALNLTGSTLFLAGAGILFGQLGTLNMADIASRIGSIENKGLVTAVAMLFFCVFGIKSAMFPLYSWLPHAYPSPPTPIAAVFAGLLTKVGVYSMYRVFGTIFVHDVAFIHETVLLPLAGLTMLLGVWGAMVQYDIRQILAFHSISQVGYILMGLSLFSPLALAAGIFHMLHHSLVKSSLFLIGGAVNYATGTQDLKKLGGLAKLSMILALVFLISSLGLAGIPPLSGFYSKFGLIVSGLYDNHPYLVFAALLTSLFTLYSMIKIWRLGFWGQALPKINKVPHQILISCGLSAVFVLLMSLFANPIMKVSKEASDQLLDHQNYIQAVIGNR